VSTNTLQTTAPGGAVAPPPSCRLCGAALTRTFVDLGKSPLCERFLRADQLNRMEAFYPLHARVCGACFLVQLEEYVAPEEIFTDYAYFSSYSDSWVEHARAYSAAMIDRLGLSDDSMVVELASNDGYLLQHFVAAGVPCLGVEPAENVAEAAIARGVPTRVVFFGEDEARRMVAEGYRADLIAANNVMAHVPDLNDFVAGMATLLKPDGVVTVEFPHLLRLMQGCQYDTIYHEHFSYFSLLTAQRVFARHGLVLFDVEELRSHGGSLRIFGAPEGSREVTERVTALLMRERAEGLDGLDAYAAFDQAVQESKRALLTFLIEARREGKRVAGYGAPGKGNTLLNYCGIRSDLLEFTVDRNPYKHGRFTPGTEIPIHPPERIDEVRPDYILILPWNLEQEIVAQLAHAREWGARFVVAIPTVRVIA
jgi:SAM-dependent methyltransferase